MSGFGVFTLMVLSGLPFCSEGFTCFCLNITCSSVINQFAMELDLPAQKLVLFRGWGWGGGTVCQFQNQ